MRKPDRGSAAGDRGRLRAAQRLRRQERRHQLDTGRHRLGAAGAAVVAEQAEVGTVGPASGGTLFRLREVAGRGKVLGRQRRERDDGDGGKLVHGGSDYP